MGDKIESDTNPMKAYIDKEVAKQGAEEISELLLDNYVSKTVVGFEGYEFPNLVHLSFIGCGLESLKGLPKLPAVRVMDLSENLLTDLSVLSENTPNLYHLNLCGNKLTSPEDLKPLSKLENLKAVDVFDCPLAENEGYRQKVFNVLPNLKYLDGFDTHNEEAEEWDLGSEDAADEDQSDGFDSEDEDVEDDVGLEYLNSSEVLKEEDNSKDYAGGDKMNGNTQKRKLDSGDDEEATTEKKSVPEDS